MRHPLCILGLHRPERTVGPCTRPGCMHVTERAWLGRIWVRHTEAPSDRVVGSPPADGYSERRRRGEHIAMGAEQVPDTGAPLPRPGTVRPRGRYELHYGMNPVSAMCWRIWDKQTQEYVSQPERGGAWEFLDEAEASARCATLPGPTDPVPEITTAAHDLVLQVDELRRRIRELDPRAYAGFITDAAVRQVAEDNHINWRTVLSAWRAARPAGERRFSPQAPRPDPLAVRTAVAEHHAEQLRQQVAQLLAERAVRA